MTLRATRCTVYSEPTAPRDRCDESTNRTAKTALHDVLRLRDFVNARVCDCGQPSSHIVTFTQLNSTRAYRIPVALPLCADCLTEFTEFDKPEHIFTLLEAYHVAKLPIPKWVTRSLAAGESVDRPATQITHRPAHGGHDARSR